jgi:tetratricopeptide (TPR) repeat protein
MTPLGGMLCAANGTPCLESTRPEETDMRAFSVSLLAILAITTVAHADDLADCSQRTDVQLTIDGCTRVVSSGALHDALLAMALNNRANAYGTLAKYDLAIADYDTAIALDPDYAHGYFNRGATHLEAGRNDLRSPI